MVNDKNMSEMEIRLDKISVPDKIQLHKQTSDIIYSDLLQDFKLSQSFSYESSWKIELFFVYICIYFMRWGLEPVLLLNVLKDIYIFEQEIECEEIIRDSCTIHITVCASFFVIVFSCAHSIIFSSYLERSVKL